MKKIIIFLLAVVMSVVIPMEGAYASTAFKLEKQTITSCLVGNHKLSVVWDKVEGDDIEYQVRFATNSSFTENVRTITVKGSDNDLTRTGLKNGKRYYVKVRTVRVKPDGKKVWGKWSGWKSRVIKSTAVFSDTSIKGIPELRYQKSSDDGDLMVLVNKYYGVKSGYLPEDMITIPSKYTTYGGAQMKEVAYKAFKRMYKAASEKGLDFKICSAYRSYSTQRSLFNNYYSSRGSRETFMLSAYPGRSEHHTGLAIDLLTGRNGWSLTNSFADTKEGKWLKKHCAEYGFILRYPEDKTDITGYGYESWHFRYVGKEAAKEIMSQDITFEEYLDKLPPGYKG